MLEAKNEKCDESCLARTKGSRVPPKSADAPPIIFLPESKSEKNESCPIELCASFIFSNFYHVAGTFSSGWDRKFAADNLEMFWYHSIELEKVGTESASRFG